MRKQLLHLSGRFRPFLVPLQDALTKLFASLARDRSMYFVVLVTENKNYLVPLVLLSCGRALYTRI